MIFVENKHVVSPGLNATQEGYIEFFIQKNYIGNQRCFHS